MAGNCAVRCSGLSSCVQICLDFGMIRPLRIQERPEKSGIVRMVGLLASVAPWLGSGCLLIVYRLMFCWDGKQEGPRRSRANEDAFAMVLYEGEVGCEFLRQFDLASRVRPKGLMHEPVLRSS